MNRSTFLGFLKLAKQVSVIKLNDYDGLNGLSDKERYCIGYWKTIKYHQDVVHSSFNVDHYRLVLENRDSNRNSLAI